MVGSETPYLLSIQYVLSVFNKLERLRRSAASLLNQEPSFTRNLVEPGRSYASGRAPARVGTRNCDFPTFFYERTDERTDGTLIYRFGFYFVCLFIYFFVGGFGPNGPKVAEGHQPSAGARKVAPVREIFFILLPPLENTLCAKMC